MDRAFKQNADRHTARLDAFEGLRASHTILRITIWFPTTLSRVGIEPSPRNQRATTALSIQSDSGYLLTKV